MLIFMDENTKAFPGHRFPELNPTSSGSKCRILSAPPQLPLEAREPVL